MDDDYRDDAELTAEQRAIVARLTPDDIADIDAILFGLVPERWRKVAYVVGKAMSASDPVRTAGVPDVFYAERIRHLVRVGMIESAGNLRRMRYSEVRKRPKPDPNALLH